MTTRSARGCWPAAGTAPARTAPGPPPGGRGAATGSRGAARPPSRRRRRGCRRHARRRAAARGPRTLETLVRYRGSVLAELFRALAALKLLQAQSRELPESDPPDAGPALLPPPRATTKRTRKSTLPSKLRLAPQSGSRSMTTWWREGRPMTAPQRVATRPSSTTTPKPNVGTSSAGGCPVLRHAVQELLVQSLCL